MSLAKKKFSFKVKERNVRHWPRGCGHLLIKQDSQKRQELEQICHKNYQTEELLQFKINGHLLAWNTPASFVDFLRVVPFHLFGWFFLRFPLFASKLKLRSCEMLWSWRCQPQRLGLNFETWHYASESLASEPLAWWHQSRCQFLDIMHQGHSLGLNALFHLDSQSNKLAIVVWYNHKPQIVIIVIMVSESLPIAWHHASELVALFVCTISPWQSENCWPVDRKQAATNGLAPKPRDQCCLG